MKKLNIELNVRRMEAQNILTTSTIKAGDPITAGSDPVWGDAPVREMGASAGTAPVRAGF